MRAILSGLLFAALAAAAAKPLEIFFIDVEGGQATLIVSPSGQSMLVDTGWPGYSNRDANRIAAVAKKAGVKKIDYVYIHSFPHRPRRRSEATRRPHPSRNFRRQRQDRRDRQERQRDDGNLRRRPLHYRKEKTARSPSA